MKEFTSSINELCDYLMGLSCREFDPCRKTELLEQCGNLRSLAEKINGLGEADDMSGIEECKTKLNSLNHYLKKLEQRDTNSSVIMPDFSRITEHIGRVISDYN